MPERFTDDEMEQLRLKYVNKLARLLRRSEPYSSSSVGVVKSIDHDDTPNGEFLARFNFHGSSTNWYFNRGSWTLELHPSQVSHD